MDMLEQAIDFYSFSPDGQYDELASESLALYRAALPWALRGLAQQAADCQAEGREQPHAELALIEGLLGAALMIDPDVRAIMGW